MATRWRPANKQGVRRLEQRYDSHLGMNLCQKCGAWTNESTGCTHCNGSVGLRNENLGGVLMSDPVFAEAAEIARNLSQAHAEAPDWPLLGPDFKAWSIWIHRWRIVDNRGGARIATTVFLFLKPDGTLAKAESEERWDTGMVTHPPEKRFLLADRPARSERVREPDWHILGGGEPEELPDVAALNELWGYLKTKPLFVEENTDSAGNTTTFYPSKIDGFSDPATWVRSHLQAFREATLST